MRFTELDTSAIADATIFLDVDGTLMRDRGDALVPGARERVVDLAKRNDVYLASNGHTERTKKLAEDLGVMALPRLSKPRTHASIRSLTRRATTVVIGDKFLTDGLLAFRLRAEFILVDSVRDALDSRYIRHSYAADAFATKAVALIALIRPHQWVKNLLVFAPAFFAGTVLAPEIFYLSLVAFFTFSLSASAVYVLNDIFDREQDRAHPKKKRRPIASGRVSVREAGALVIALLLGIAALLFIYPALLPVIALYIAVNVAYSGWLKHLAVIDILAVASFYIMRVVAGSVVTGIPLSPWIILCAFFFALFVIIGKRRAEFRHEARRRVLDQYSKEALDFMLAGSAALTIISYGLYTVIGHPIPYLIYSTVFVVVAIFYTMNRMYLNPEHAESPERMLFKEPVLFISLLLWTVYVFTVFYIA